jgi:hypothetical protein
VFLAHAKLLEKFNAKYPVCRAVCKTLTVPVIFLEVSHEKLFSWQLPTRLVVGLVENAAFDKNNGKNPFNFQHFNLAEISVHLDGLQQHTIQPLLPNYT